MKMSIISDYWHLLTLERFFCQLDQTWDNVQNSREVYLLLDLILLFVVCGKCTKLFKENDWVKKVNGTYQANVCNNVLFPRSSRRKPCGGKLVKKVCMSNGAVKFYPIYTYCFKSNIDSILTLLKRPGARKGVRNGAKEESTKIRMRT